MPSLKSRAFVLMLRANQWRTRRKNGSGGELTIEHFRKQVTAGARAFGRVSEQVTIEPVQIGEMHAEWMLPAGATHKDRVILYFHGGGYVSGDCESHRVHVAKFVLGSGLPALLFGYRLAPEHPHPAALDDALAAYRWLLAEGVNPARIAFVGDSAGGGLLLATLLALKDQGDPLPAAAVALSPWTDLKCTGDSITTKRDVDVFTPDGAWTLFSQSYVGENDPGLPLISPLYGDLSGLPPILIYAGDHDVLFDDSTRFVTKAQAAGVDATLHVGEGLFHCYPACGSLFPEAQQAMTEICAFLNAQIND